MKQIIWILNYFSMASVLGIAVWQDIWTWKIKNVLNVAGVLFGFLFALLLPEKGIFMALAGFAVMLGVGLLCWNLHVFRAGDAKLLCVVGTFLGWKSGLSCLLTSIVIGAIAGLPFILRRLLKKQKGKTRFPFSLAIALAVLMEVCFGHLWNILFYH